MEHTPVKCPECGEMSDSIKSYTLPDISYFFVAIKWNREHHICCANCMRKKILGAAVMGLCKTNVLWPIFCFPRLSVNLTRTFVKGHSEDIIENMINDLQFNSQQEWK